MLLTIGFTTYLAASVGFTALGIFLAVYRRANPLGFSLFIACGTTAIWAVITAFSTTITLPVPLVHIAELARNSCWLFLLCQMLGLQSDGNPDTIGGKRWRRLFFLLLAAALTLIAIPPLWTSVQPQGLHYQFVLILWLSLALLGLLLIEQLFRNATQTMRWSIKHLCLGLGILLAYDFFMYSEALLFRQLNTDLWQARGLVNALAIPLLAVAIARDSNWRVNVQISHELAFHTVTLIGAGLYLLGMAAAGYAIKYLGGSWGGVLQMGFLTAAAALLLILLFSGRLRAQIRVLLSKHFLSYRYDYREEWLRFTRALASLNEEVSEGIIRIMAPLVSSQAGLLWASSDETQTMQLLAHWQMPLEQAGADLGQLPTWLEETDWVIDLDEWRRRPDVYANLQLPTWLQEDEQLWLITPLVFRDRLQAILILKKSSLKDSINWEDRDLLKTAGRQAATHLAQHLASNALVEARQFEAFNRLSAYVVHDLKNILAQQSLIVSNAEKHRHNPAFVDDMISTVENSVSRMTRLMEQMRSGIRSAPADNVSLPTLLQEVIANRSNTLPVPRAEFSSADAALADSNPEENKCNLTACHVEADRDRLATVFSHLIQNAQEATPSQGEVIIRLHQEEGSARVVVEDTGRGMSADFIRNRLFRPFESTKGLTGMGIGAFESRDYIRQLGGDIIVFSTPGEGTTFHVSIPTIDREAL